MISTLGDLTGAVAQHCINGDDRLLNDALRSSRRQQAENVMLNPVATPDSRLVCDYEQSWLYARQRVREWGKARTDAAASWAGSAACRSVGSHAGSYAGQRH